MMRPEDFGDLTVGELLASYVPEARASDVKALIEEELCVRIVASVLRADLAGIIEREGGEVLRASLPGPVAAFLGGSAMSGISSRMAEAIKDRLLTNGREIIIPLIDEELTELENEPVKNILEKLWNTDA
ncbi:MAG: hypothetical protein LBL36_05225 [Clostridiales Family XIII bacterium]|jgi:hypothetical protein|nr:hypothetical protein [Clostridiales Family XIII bacterium]